MDGFWAGRSGASSSSSSLTARSLSNSDGLQGSRSRSDSTATSESTNNNAASPVFSSATISSSSVSVLEVVQFATLQFHQLSHESEDKRSEYISLIMENMPTLSPDSWFLTQLPTCTAVSSRTSVLGFLSIIYEFWGDKDNGSQAKTNDQEAESENSGARALVTSGLKFLLRCLDILLSSPSSTTIESIREAASSGVRLPAASAPHASFPPIPKLWPSSEASSEFDASSPDAMKKKAAKSAQAKAMERMKSLQSKFAEANVEELKAEGEDDESLCIICRCSNNEPMGYIAHAQRCRTVVNSVADERTEMKKLCVVVGDLGCQLRATADMKSKKVGLLGEGTLVTVIKHGSEENSSPLHSRRVLVEAGDVRGWASYISSSGYTILRHLIDDGKKQRWGGTRPLLKYCSHIAHLACVEKHVLSLHQKSADGVQYMGYYSANINNGEFLCPLCHSISNILVPKATKSSNVDDTGEKDGEDGKAEEGRKAAVDQFTSELLNTMQAPHIVSKRVDSNTSHYLTGQWDTIKLKPYRALLVGFSSIGFGASSLQQQFDFNLKSIETTVSAMKVMITTYDGESSKVKEALLDQFYLRMPSVWKRANDEPKTAYDEICSFVSSIPVHVARDGTLDHDSSGRCALASAYWLQREKVRGDTGERHFFPSNKDSSPPYNFIPMPFSACVSEVEDVDESKWVDADLVASAWPLLPVLSWDLSTYAGAIFSLGVESSEVATVVKLLTLARAVQIVTCDLEDSQPWGSEGVFSCSGESLCALLKDMKGPFREKVGEKLTPYLKVFLIVAKASCAVDTEFLQPVDDLLYEETAFDIIDGLGFSLEDIFADEVETVTAWLDDLQQLEKWQEYNSNRKHDAILDKYVSVARTKTEASSGNSMEIDIPASFDKLHDLGEFRQVNSYFTNIGMSPVLSPQLSLTGSTRIRVSKDVAFKPPIVVRDFSHELSVCPSMDYNPFMELPKMFVDLYSLVNESESLSFENEEEKVEFAIDLVTGMVVRAGKATNAAGRLGSCTQLARKNGGIGIFFLLSKATILLISGLKAVYWGSIYLDKNGEEDLGLKRGRPLFLNEERLRKLKDLYLKNDIVKEVAAMRSNAERVIREGWY